MTFTITRTSCNLCAPLTACSGACKHPGSHSIPNLPPHIFVPAPIGCICPPGANKDCERSDCPRKAAIRSAP
jgi:hypothetical protein